MPTLETIAILNLVITAMLTGLIWTIQIVHYPLFAYVSPTDFPNYEKHHVNKITYIVAPLMLSELLLAICVFIYQTTSSTFTTLTYLNLAILILIWLSTWLLQVPCHNQLKTEYNLDTIKKLSHTNWLRTLLWTAKTIIAALLLTNTTS